MTVICPSNLKHEQWYPLLAHCLSAESDGGLAQKVNAIKLAG